MKIDPMRLQRMNSSIELKKKHDRGSQSILVCLRCSDYLGQQKSSYDLFLSKSIHIGVFLQPR
jgi:ribosomal protein S26